MVERANIIIGARFTRIPGRPESGRLCRQEEQERREDVARTQQSVRHLVLAFLLEFLSSCLNPIQNARTSSTTTIAGIVEVGSDLRQMKTTMNFKSISTDWRFRIVRILMMAAIIGYLMYQSQNKPVAEGPAPAQIPANGPADVPIEIDMPSRSEGEKSEPIEPDDTLKSEKPQRPVIRRYTVANQSIRDEQGRVAYEGSIDLTETVERIRNGETLDRYRNDGSTFQNRERRLPKQPEGYYREWVHRTPKVNGPGPQRVISGRSGELWYTPDHYRTFVRLDE